MKIHKYMIKYVMAVVLAIVVSVTSMQPVYAKKDCEEPGEYTDEEWAEIEDAQSDMMDSDIDGDSSWDHITWDTKHRDLAWAVFSGTEWTGECFPSLNFSQYGTSTVDAPNMTEAEKQNVQEYIKNYKFASGTYSTKDKDTGKIDNSAYVNLVIAIMDTLKSKGTSDDPYAIQLYVYGGKKQYSPYTTANANYERNCAALIFSRLVNAERAYNQYHSPHANIFKSYSGSEGLYMMIQGCLYGSGYSRQKNVNAYSEENANEYYDAKRSGQGYTKWNDFATYVVAKYHPAENAESYIMDGFGNKIE